jgi:hypothetical protein
MKLPTKASETFVSLDKTMNKKAGCQDGTELSDWIKGAPVSAD